VEETATGYDADAVVLVLVEELGCWVPYDVVGGGIPI
jgi:hypothetical protein